MKNIFLSYLFILLIITCCCNNTIKENTTPLINFTYVPVFGSFDNLNGKVENIKISDFNIVVYIKVSGSWWTKPTSINPITEINNDGTWECDITSGGIDEQATEIVAYLIKKDYSPPILNGSSGIPDELERNSVAKAQKIREPTYRKINFSGYNWIVKTSTIPVGPGPNYFSDSEELAFVDDSGFVHLKILEKQGKWLCSEIICTEIFGYGTYIFYLSSRVDEINENAVLGLFTWSDIYDYHHREIDIEFSRWSNPDNLNSQYVVQPWENPLNMHRFNTELAELNSTHIFTWNKDSIHFQSFKGHHQYPPNKSYLINEWKYKAKDIPIPGNENVRINLWLFNGIKPSDEKEVEIVLKKFEFIKE
jgi:hypothetical protein